jgi:N6-adenosine-specific RNA methylase IME4
VSELVRVEASAPAGQDPLTEFEARRLTDEVKADAHALWRKLLRLYEGEAHVALGYASWHSYCEAEFDMGRSHAYRLLDAGRVAAVVPQLGNEAQARELVPLLDRPDELHDVVRELRDLHGERITADLLRASVQYRLGVEDMKQRRLEPVETPPLPVGRYRCIVADPPWHLPPTGPRTGNGWPGTEGFHSVLPYPTMTLDEITALPVADLAADGAHLYLWTINRYVEASYAVARAWGFEPSTLITWAKPPRGLGLGGPWVLTTEHVLFCRRGSLKATGRIDSTWHAFPRRGHSRKPDEFLDLVEQVSPGPYVELFARRPREGWTVWGNEAAA